MWYLCLEMAGTLSSVSHAYCYISEHRTCEKRLVHWSPPVDTLCWSGVVWSPGGLWASYQVELMTTVGSSLYAAPSCGPQIPAFLLDPQSYWHSFYYILLLTFIYVYKNQILYKISVLSPCIEQFWAI